MRDYSFERLLEQIPDPETRENFHEVLQCYWRGNGRAALVTLWVVIVFDLIRKLESARDAYDDSKAKNILEEIATQRHNEPRSSKWEWDLIELIFDQTNYLSTADYTRLEGIQRFRHLAAHPTFDNGVSLYNPNSDTVRANIHDALEVVLLKSDFMTRDVFKSFVEELERIKGTFATTNKLKLYLENKYFKHLPGPVEASIFRSLWKLVFRNLGDQEASNRSINYEVLTILYERNQFSRKSQIESEFNYFSNIEPTGEPIEYLTRFMLFYPEVYILLNGVWPAVEQYLENTPTLSAANWLKEESIANYLTKVLIEFESDDPPYYVSTSFYTHESRKLFHPDALQIIVLKGVAMGVSNLTKKIAITAYRYARSYDAADSVFSVGIKPQLNNMERDDLLLLLNSIEENNQTTQRMRSRQDHPLVKARCDSVFGDDFDYSKFPHIKMF